MAPRTLAALAAALLAGCASTPPVHELTGEGLGSTWSVKIAGAAELDVPALRQGVQQQIDEVARQLSRWDSASSLSTLNARDDAEWFSLPDQLFTAMSYALELAASTGGAFDPTIAPLVDVWGFGLQGRRYQPPSAEQVDAARARVGWARIALDPSTKRVRRPRGVVIDLSSMTHGLAADQIAAYLRGQGIDRFLIDVGSELRAQGEAPGDHAWRVAIERPPSELSAATVATEGRASASQSLDAPAALDGSAAAQSLRVISLRNAGIATSGNYRYYFDYDGRRYSHRIDPRTGGPVAHALASVTVIDGLCMRADALATALTVLGPDAGFAYAQRHSIAALFVVRTARGLEERMTAPFQSYLN